MSRNRNEAAWTHDEARVKGRRRNRAWVLIGLFVTAVAIISLSWARYMNIQDVTYELRVCQQPLTTDASWSEVQAAACDPATTSGNWLTLWAAGDQQDASSVQAQSWIFESVPVNSSATSIQLDLAQPARTVVLAEPDSQTVRRDLTKDKQGLTWTANVGGRGPTTYWVLVTR